MSINTKWFTTSLIADLFTGLQNSINITVYVPVESYGLNYTVKNHVEVHPGRSSMAEYSPWERKVAGSNPVVPNYCLYFLLYIAKSMLRFIRNCSCNSNSRHISFSSYLFPFYILIGNLIFLLL